MSDSTPPYSADYSKSDEYFKIECELLSKCDKTMDIIVLPEMADMPCLCKTKEERLLSVEKYNDVLLGCNNWLLTSKKRYS